MSSLSIAEKNLGKVITFYQNKRSDKLYNNKIAVLQGSNIQLIEYNQISHLQSDSNYTKIWLSNGVKILSCKTLKRFEDRVDATQFLRIHNSYIINADQISIFDTSVNKVKMKDGSQIPVSRARKYVLIKYLKTLMV